MIRLWDDLIQRTTGHRERDLEDALFQAFCLIGAFVSLVLVLPVELFLDANFLESTAIGLFGGLSLLLFWLARRGHSLPSVYAWGFIFILDCSWFLNGGSQGSNTMFLFPPLILMVILLRGLSRWLSLVAFVANGMALILIESAHPEWIHPFISPTQRLLELLAGFVTSVFISVVTMGVIVERFRRERRQLRDVNQALEHSLSEIRTLRGLLPICAWCKRVRDDEGLWTQIERYIADHSEATFSHGMCPQCAEEYRDQMIQDARRRGLQEPPKS